MKTIILLLSFLSFSASQTLQKKDFSFVETDDHNSERLVKRVVNKNYDFISQYNNGKFDDILLEQTFDQTIVPGVEGRRARVKIIAWGYKNKKFEKFLWEIDDIGYTVGKYDEYLRLSNYGCCGAENAYIYYNLKTGKKFLTASSDFANISVPNTKNKRIITFLSSHAEIQYNVIPDYPHQLGILYYTDGHEILQEVLIVGELNDLHGSPNIGFLDKGEFSKYFTVWDANFNENSDAISGFSTTLDFGFFKIEIPIYYDRFDIVDAILPKEYDIRLIPVGNNQDEYLNDLRYEELNSSKDSLRILRNEIFARHGQSFKSEDLKKYFSKKIWYKEIPGYKVSKELLSEKEIIIFKMIQNLESNL